MCGRSTADGELTTPRDRFAGWRRSLRVDLRPNLRPRFEASPGEQTRKLVHNTSGQLGQGHTDNIGDNELPSSVPVISLGNTPIVDIVSGGVHTCVRYDDDTIRCWGHNNNGSLGYGNTDWIGDNELPSSVGTVDVGAPVDEILLSLRNTCIRSGTDVKCWGDGVDGVNGQANSNSLGDDELPSSIGPIDLGFDATGLAWGAGYHVCAHDGQDMRCWGRGTGGALGYGNTNDIGDDETPASAGNVPWY